MALSTTRIGRGVVVRGSVRGDGDLAVEGRVEGVIDVRGDVAIDVGAHVQAPVAGDRVTIRGAVAGDVRGEASVVLEEGARVVGDLHAPSIGIRPGGLLRGYVSTTGKAAGGSTSAARQAARADRGVATPAPRAHRPQSLQRARDEISPPRPAPSPAPAPAAKPAPAGARPAATMPTGRSESRSFVEPSPSPLTRSSAGGPPPPVVPTLKKGARGAVKKKGGR
jgi:cytoskeletal protein CcmA (bactofilin family)